MQITLVDINANLVKVWQETCADLAGVSIQHGSIFDVNCDALVSPANSFGFMDGGLDLLISHRFGWQVQEALQARIKNKHHGELLVGMADIVPTNDLKTPYVISAPTMRVPMILGRPSVNVYLATRAVLLLIKHGTFDDGTPIKMAVERVAFPGMGTGVGHVPLDVCATQMRAAIEEVVLEKQQFPESWYEAQQRHQLLFGAKPRDLQHPE